MVDNEDMGWDWEDGRTDKMVVASGGSGIEWVEKRNPESWGEKTRTALAVGGFGGIGVGGIGRMVVDTTGFA
jgi:hypothetical protein